MASQRQQNNEHYNTWNIVSFHSPQVFPRTIEYVAPEPEPIINQYDVELTRWVEKLAKCESSNNPNAINHFDGGSESIGYVQYKRTTWAMYNKKFGLSYTEEDIWSREAQIEMTKAVIRTIMLGETGIIALTILQHLILLDYHLSMKIKEGGN